MPTLALLRMLRGPADIWWQVPERLHAQCATLVAAGLVAVARHEGTPLYRLTEAGSREACIGEGPLDAEGPSDYTVHGPAVCPRPCSECPDRKHHWIDCCPDPEDPESDIERAMLAAGVEAGYVCKHCGAWAEDGPGS